MTKGADKRCSDMLRPDAQLQAPAFHLAFAKCTPSCRSCGTGARRPLPAAGLQALFIRRNHLLRKIQRRRCAPRSSIVCRGASAAARRRGCRCIQLQFRHIDENARGRRHSCVARRTIHARGSQRPYRRNITLATNNGLRRRAPRTRWRASGLRRTCRCPCRLRFHVGGFFDRGRPEVASIA